MWRNMPRTRIKICGITRVDDALLACELGADAIGLVMTPGSPRRIDLDRARAIRNGLPAFVDAVVLTHDLPAPRVREIIDAVRPDLVQFHGSEDAAFCESFGLPYVKAIGMDGVVDTSALAAAQPQAAGFVLDGHAPGAQGGQGKTFDWSRVPRDLGRPIILAGGLNAENVAEAIRCVWPWAVDVASGVESAPGIKDHEKLRAFFAAINETQRDMAAT
ncbi:MAG: phosphoribosylanthranilate isomerase [Rhodanobacteraceae bacterium]